jgi:hypothetical protein
LLCGSLEISQYKENTPGITVGKTIQYSPRLDIYTYIPIGELGQSSHHRRQRYHHISQSTSQQNPRRTRLLRPHDQQFPSIASNTGNKPNNQTPTTKIYDDSTTIMPTPLDRALNQKVRYRIHTHWSDETTSVKEKGKKKKKKKPTNSLARKPQQKKQKPKGKESAWGFSQQRNLPELIIINHN